MLLSLFLITAFLPPAANPIVSKMNPSDEDPLTEEQCLADSVTSMVDQLLTQLQTTNTFYSPGGPTFRTVRMKLLDLKSQYYSNTIDLQQYSDRAARCSEELLDPLMYQWAKSVYTLPRQNPLPFPPTYEGVEVSLNDFSRAHMQMRRSDRWNGYESTHMRGQFNIVNVEEFRCPRCVTNVHSVETCSAPYPRCAHCWEVGHQTSTCQYHLCVHCLRYGHSRRRCPERHLPARCNRCFINTSEHVGRDCPNPKKMYCRHCGLEHNHKLCPDVSPQRRALCYKHKGAHNFSECPNPSNG
uniref:Glyco_trans_2-like domain-containing protein n=1 Tax=Panagrellus redivivus TaxID=6233 RepID=A0A7E4WD39_PANRE